MPAPLSTPPIAGNGWEQRLRRIAVRTSVAAIVAGGLATAAGATTGGWWALAVLAGGGVVAMQRGPYKPFNRRALRQVQRWNRFDRPDGSPRLLADAFRDVPVPGLYEWRRWPENKSMLRRYAVVSRIPGNAVQVFTVDEGQNAHALWEAPLTLRRTRIRRREVLRAGTFTKVELARMTPQVRATALEKYVAGPNPQWVATIAAL